MSFLFGQEFELRKKKDEWDKEREKRDQEWEEKKKKQQEEFEAQQQEREKEVQVLIEKKAIALQKKRDELAARVAMLNFDEKGPFPDADEEVKDSLLSATKALGDAFHNVEVNVARLSATPQPPSGVFTKVGAALSGAFSSTVAAQNADAEANAQELAQWKTQDFALCRVLEFQVELLHKMKVTRGLPIDYDEEKTKAGKRRRIYEVSEQHVASGGGCNCDGKKSKTGECCHGRSRCPCKIGRRPCGFHCRCKHQPCSNPFGTNNTNRGTSSSSLTPTVVMDNANRGSGQWLRTGGGTSSSSLAPTVVMDTGTIFRYEADPDYYPNDPLPPPPPLPQPTSPPEPEAAEPAEPEFHPNIWRKIGDDIFELIKETNYDGDADEGPFTGGQCEDVDEEGEHIFFCSECDAPTQHDTCCKKCCEEVRSLFFLCFFSLFVLFMWSVLGCSLRRRRGRVRGKRLLSPGCGFARLRSTFHVLLPPLLRVQLG